MEPKKAGQPGKQEEDGREIGHDFSAGKSFSRLHMFRAYRRPVRYWGLPLLIALGISDYIKIPDLANQWMGARVAIVAYGLGSFFLMANYGWARRRIVWFVAGLMALVSMFANVKILTTGGTTSPYLPSLLVASSAFILVFRLRRRHAIFSQLLFVLPTVIALCLFSPGAQRSDAIVTSVFYLAMVVLAAAGTISAEELDKIFNCAFQTALREVERMRRSDFLKSHFPPAIRQEVDSGKFNLDRKQVIAEAVVGFADIIGSTKIGNSVDLETDWKLKEAFISAATARATECGMVVLNQMGDGLFFLANYGNPPDWQENVVKFHERLTIDLEQILIAMEAEIGNVTSGVRFGLARGPVMLGWIGQGTQSYFTAMGPEVNLAARLCSVAGPGEMVISSKASYAMERAFAHRNYEQKLHSLKGFDLAVPAIHLKCLVESESAKTSAA